MSESTDTVIEEWIESTGSDNPYRSDQTPGQEFEKLAGTNTQQSARLAYARRGFKGSREIPHLDEHWARVNVTRDRSK